MAGLCPHGCGNKAQIDDALEHHRNLNSIRPVKHLLRIMNLMLRMEGCAMIEEGRATQSDFEYMRCRPYPDRPRRPRINRPRMRIEAALRHKQAREAKQ
jgi:hypothetical protein